MNFNDEIVQSRKVLIGAACKGLEDPSPGSAPHVSQAQAPPREQAHEVSQQVLAGLSFLKTEVWKVLW